jgi:hypothetical protein
VRRYELWIGPESESFFDEGNELARRFAIEDGATLVCEVEAPSTNAAMRAYHEYRDLEPYKLMLRPDGTPYPEDEDDDYQPPAEPSES